MENEHKNCRYRFWRWLIGQLEKLYALGKQGWNWGEWLFGAYLGGMLVLWLG